MIRVLQVFIAGFCCLGIIVSAHAQSVVDYDIVYVKAPRNGDTSNTKWPEVKDPIQAEPGTDLVLLHPNGSEEVLVAGGNGAVVDPYVSFDGKWIYYAKFHDVQPSALNSQRRNAPRSGSDIYKINIDTREIVRLTFQEWTPNNAVGNWSDSHLSATPSGTDYIGYGVFNLGPCPLPDGKVMFSSSRNGFLPNKSFTFPLLQLYVMDEKDGKNIELVGHMNLGGALHPTILMDGRVAFSSYEAQGLRDRRIWGLWSIYPDGRRWAPMMSAMTAPSAFHFQTQLYNGDLAVVEYYNQNNNGFGLLLGFPSTPPAGEPPFGNPKANHQTNPLVRRGIWSFDPSHPSHLKPRYKQYSFSPKGLYSLSGFTHGEDNAASKNLQGAYAGKVTHPSAAPNQNLLLVWTPGPANDLNRPTPLPYYDGGIYLQPGSLPIVDEQNLVLIKNDPLFNEQQPRAVVPYEDTYGIPEPAKLPWLPNDGSETTELPAGTPFGLVGTSSFYKRDTSPGSGSSNFDGLDPFNTSQNGASTNWGSQGSDAGKYDNADIYAVRILSMEPSSHMSYGPSAGPSGGRNYFNHASERLRILGELPLRKKDSQGNTIFDPEGNPDTSFLAKIPADTPFTFQTLDKDGLVLNMSQTWHQVRPGETRNDCGGCHAHSKNGLDFSQTEASKSNYQVPDITSNTPLLSKDAQGNTVFSTNAARAVDVEYYRDIKPVLQRSCVQCHTENSQTPPAGLVLDDDTKVGLFENTFNRLCNDTSAQYGIPPVINNGSWRQTNASRYIRKFQARRSLLIWKLFGRRLDGWTNSDHPTESTLGDPSTLPFGANPNDADIDYIGTIMPPPNSGVPALSEDEKITFARWVDLGCPITRPEPQYQASGWFADDLRPTLTIASPRPGRDTKPLNVIRIGAYDYYSGLDQSTLSVTANININGRAAGQELSDLFNETADHIWTLVLNQPITELSGGEITVSVKDTAGNITTAQRTYNIDMDTDPDSDPDSDPDPDPDPGTTILLAPSNLRVTGVK